MVPLNLCAVGKRNLYRKLELCSTRNLTDAIPDFATVVMPEHCNPRLNRGILQTGVV